MGIPLPTPVNNCLLLFTAVYRCKYAANPDITANPRFEKTILKNTFVISCGNTSVKNKLN
jgi:hypothetical protein